MAFFWGVEIKAGKPYVHEFDEERGPLHISQATLGNYSTKHTTKRIIVQCNVGDNAPIYLCSLFPEKNETCLLNLQFAEEDEVTFSVVGPHSVHLSGFFTGPMPGTCGHDQEGEEDDDFDSYGEDISETESDDDSSTEYDTDDDMDEFIDHNMFPETVPNSGVRIEEIIDDEKPTDRNGLSLKPKKKKSKQSGLDDEDNSEKQIVVKNTASEAVLESEDEDGFPLSLQGHTKNDFPNTNKKAEDKIIDEGAGRQKGKENSVKRKIHGDDNQLSDDETNDKQTRKNKKKKVKGKEEKVTDSGTGNKSDLHAEEAITIHMDQAVGVSEGEPNTGKDKKKKNKKKKQASTTDANLEQNISDKNGSAMEIEKKAEGRPFKGRSFDNGLVIEELEMGKPDGKRASPGKKVSVHYIGKLKKNGKIFDSNTGKAPFKFRLGIGQVIKGWDVGVKGMRVGDKRRLTIPPSMGYGAKGAGKDIPPNAWLVFDVELVDVN